MASIDVDSAGSPTHSTTRATPHHTSSTAPLKLLVRSSYQTLAYEPVWHAMRQFTQNRLPNAHDELWLLEHQPVYTQGQAGKAEHLLRTGTIPVVQTDRGGQVSYHGPGQLMIYTLFDAVRMQLGAHALVNKLEQVLIAVLADINVSAYTRREAPGVYVLHNGAEVKIAALGLRLRKLGCYHGAALNISTDLSAFIGINPCGYVGQKTTRLLDLLAEMPTRRVIEQRVVAQMARIFHYTEISYAPLVIASAPTSPRAPYE
jgi:lipoyl(octanoyl) transferase